MNNNKATYIITNLCSGDDFEMELTDEQLSAIKTLKDELGYVMEDISIEEKIN